MNPFRLGWASACIALALAWSGCASQPTVPGSSDTKTQDLRIALPDQPRRLDPAYSKDLYEGIASGLLYDGLLGYGASSELEPRLAYRHEVSEDRTSMTFHLRPEALFHNNVPVTSADVRWSFERVLDPATASDRRWVLNPIAGSDQFTSGLVTTLPGLLTPDLHTVVIRLGRPHPGFLTQLAMPAASIVPKGSALPPDGSTTHGATAGTTLDRAPIGTGPWKLTDWQRERRLIFERNNLFWGPKPTFDRLVWNVISDDSVRRNTFAQGQVDIVEVGFQEWDRYQSTPQLKARLLPNQELRTDFVGFGCARPGISDPRVRRALRLALPTDQVFQQIQRSRGIPATGPVPPLPGWQSPPPTPSNPEQARTLLAEAGYSKDRPLKISLWYRELALQGEIAAAIRDAWRALGIEVDLVSRDQAAFRAAIWSGQPDAFLGSWTLDYPDPENALVPPFHSRNIPRQGNQTHFRDPLTDQLLDQAQTTTDSDARWKIYQSAELRINELSPWIPLFHRRTYYDTSDRVTGWKPKLMYNADRYLDAKPAQP